MDMESADGCGEQNKRMFAKMNPVLSGFRKLNGTSRHAGFAVGKGIDRGGFHRQDRNLSRGERQGCGLRGRRR